MNINKLQEILNDLQEREPILTDDGTAVLSQAQIDRDCANLKEIIRRYATYQS